MKRKINFNRFLPANGLQLACYKASVKYGAIVTDLKGKVGGQTFQGGAAGGQLKNSSRPVKAITGQSKLNGSSYTRVIETKSNLATVASAWRGLDDSQRLSWLTGAVNFPFKNKYGNLYTPSGFQLFMSVNTNLLAVGIAYRFDCPTPPILHATPEILMAYDTSTPGALYLNTVVPADSVVILYACVSQSTGKTITAGRMKAIKILPTASYVANNVGGDYIAVFGTIPEAGNIWFQAVMTDLASGRLCLPATFQLLYPT